MARRPLATSSYAESSEKILEGVQSAKPKVPSKFNPFPFEYHEEMDLKVVSLTNLGIGICRTPLPNKQQTGAPKDWVIMVPNVIPGELVRLRIFRNHNTYSDADLVEVLEASPDRVEPRCVLSNVCGGCQYQHMSINKQREWKTQQVEELLERIAELPNVAVTPTLGTDHIFHYRSKLTPHYDPPKKLSDDVYEIQEIGFKRKDSRALVDVPYCHIATEAINERLATYREEKREEAHQNKLKRPRRGATLLLRHAAEGVSTDHNEYVTTTVKDLKFRFLAGNFFQNNPFMLPVMVDKVVEAATRPSSDGTTMTHLIDCYCGSGLFCLASSKHFDVCVGIELNKKAIEEATANAKLNQIENCAFVSASAEAIFESNDSVLDGVDKVKDFPRDSTVVVCDPPRKGCSVEFLEQLYEYGPRRVVYMSCDPATQARDAKGIVGAGYQITSVQPFDLFPQTRHIECLVTFEKDHPNN